MSYHLLFENEKQVTPPTFLAHSVWAANYWKTQLYKTEHEIGAFETHRTVNVTNEAISFSCSKKTAILWLQSLVYNAARGKMSIKSVISP